MKKIIYAILFTCAGALSFAQPPAGKNWKLVFEDDFNYETAKLEDNWTLMNEPQRQMLCGRWKENAVTENGILRLLNKKETREGQNWTSASLWTKKTFKYGYFECRYRYAKSSGVNNAFWVATYRSSAPEGVARFEVDVNEGHYPDEIATNIHNWSDTWVDSSGAKRHRGWPMRFKMGKAQGAPFYEHKLDTAMGMEKIRFSSSADRFFRIREISAFAQTKDGVYPDPSKPLTQQPAFAGLENFALNAKTEASGVYYKSKSSLPALAADGNFNSSWASQSSGDKFLEIDLGGKKSVACIQILGGWNNKGEWSSYPSFYKLEYFADGKWRTLAETKPDAPDVDLSADFHTYGLEWNDREVVIYFDGKELRRFEHEFIRNPAPVLLSAAIVEWAGAVTDAVDGTSMDIDYVKIWQQQ